MKYWLNLSLVLALSSVFTVAKAQIPVRPYGQWEATQFVAVSVHQPEDYVTLDNNWEILYNLRTPHTFRPVPEGWVSSALIANCCY